MKEKYNKINRRNFLKTMGAAGLGSVFVSARVKAGPNEPNTGKTQEATYPQVPKRKLGKTGAEVPCLAMGGAVNLIDNQIMLRKALEWGVTYWDTSDSYEGGNSELGIGKYLSNNPQMRKELFIVTKAYGTKTTEDVELHLKESLKKMNTSYIDLYFIMERVRTDHGLSDPSQLNDELKRWAEDAKKRKMIRFFGFSTHKNMAQCLAAAAKLGWIDAIMTAYNFRLMQDAEMAAAVEECHKAGIGLIAMKTQAGGQKLETEEDKKLLKHLLEQGFTEGQAKIKAVLEDKRISSVCSRMENIAVLTENVAAALDKTKFTRADMEILKEYAAATCSGYCAGCANVCDSALPGTPYISDIMRYLMYYNVYGDQSSARELFAQIPRNVRKKLLSTDYSLAEAYCPQHLPISKLVAEAVSKLA
jgi:predicted aldo/keto reductase-like oxidoreductase